MKPEVHERLRELSDETDKEYGKLVQKLLAIAFLEAGAEAVTDRCTQGIDLELTWRGRRRALEVKTCAGGTLRLGAKDLAGLAAREEGGATAYVAVLGGRLLDEWIIARFHRGELAPGELYSITRLRPYREAELEAAVAAKFDDALHEHRAAAAGRNGQRALDDVLARYPGYRRA